MCKVDHIDCNQNCETCSFAINKCPIRRAVIVANEFIRSYYELTDFDNEEEDEEKSIKNHDWREIRPKDKIGETPQIRLEN